MAELAQLQETLTAMRKTILKFIAWMALIVFLGVGAPILALYMHFYRSPPEASYPHPADALEAQRQDLDYFATLISLDRAFTPSTRAEASRRLLDIGARTSPLDHEHLRIALMQIVALSDNGHSKLGYDPGASPQELPVRVALFSDGVYVMRSTASAADLLGGRLIDIDGKPIDEVLKRLETLRGGAEQWRRAYATLYIYFQDFLYGLDVATNQHESTWTVMAPSGSLVTRTLQAYKPAESEPYVYVKRWLSSEPLDGLTEGWQAYQPNRELPLSLREFDKPFRRVHLPNSCVMFLQYKSNDDEANQSIRSFTAETATDMRAQPPCDLIMDVRYDDGGNYLKTASFMRRLPQYIGLKGHIYLLTGPATFSAGIVTSAFN